MHLKKKKKNRLNVICKYRIPLVLSNVSHFTFSNEVDGKAESENRSYRVTDYVDIFLKLDLK